MFLRNPTLSCAINPASELGRHTDPMRLGFQFFRLADKISVAAERNFWRFSTVLVLLLLACGILKDVRKKMWIDELYTLHMAQLGNAGEIVKATLEGCDGAPPFYAMIVHVILPWTQQDAVAVRLPSTLGFCGMVLCLLAICRRRMSAVYSLVAALLAALACFGYATEGRGYGLMVFFAAAALLCWQAATEGRRRIVAIPLLALCVSLMTAIHYYALFFSVPIFLAEIVRWRKSGKLDFSVLAAMTPVLLVLGLHYPFILASKQFQEHFWSPATWGSVPAIYATYLVMSAPLMLLALFSRVLEEDRITKDASLTIAEWIALVTFALMPLFVATLSIYTTHALVDRYTLWAVPGFAIMVSVLLCRATRAKTALGVSVLSLLLVLTAAGEVYGLSKKPVLQDGERVRLELATLSESSEPIVVADHHVFMELSYYGQPQLRDRLVYPVSRDLDLRYLGYDTGALLLTALSHRTKLHVLGYNAVLAAYPRFVLAALPRDYLPWHLVRAGYRVVPIGASRVPLLFEVESPEANRETIGNLDWSCEQLQLGVLGKC
jgi:Dolichyl-phosphate-mannose-protein mannosyltransferase